MRMNIETDLAHEMALDNILAIQEARKTAESINTGLITILKGFQAKTLKEEQEKLARIESASEYITMIQDVNNLNAENFELIKEISGFVIELDLDAEAFMEYYSEYMRQLSVSLHILKQESDRLKTSKSHDNHRPLENLA